MKTNFTKAFTWLIALLFVAHFTFAQQIITTVPTLTVCPGTENVQVPVTVQNLSGVNSISLSLEFNNTAVTYVSYTANSILTENGGMLLVNCPPPYNKVKAAFFSITPVSFPENEILFTFTFNVTSSSQLIWDVYTPGACQYGDFDAQPLPSEFINGAILAYLPDATFSYTQQICEGQNAGVAINFIHGVPPFIFTYNDGINPDVTDTALTNNFLINPVLTNTTTFNLLTITDATGCTNSQVNKSATVYVAPLANLFNVSGGGYRCENGEGVSVSLDGSQSGLVYSLYLNGEPTGYWQYGADQPLTFGGLSSDGIYTIIAQNDCGNREMTGSATITVLPLPEVTLGAINPVCYLTEPFLLSGGSPIGGTYSGLGVEDGYFHTEYYGPGEYTITYTYTDPNGCINYTSQQLFVLGLPSVYFEPLPPVCGDSDSLELIAEPAGGVFSGPGIIDGYFYPLLAGSGIHTLTFTYSDLQGCSNSVSQDVAVFPLPEVSISPVNNICANENPVELFGTPENGWFEGPGVSGNMFYPELATAGSWTLSYYFTNEFGCTNSSSTQVTVLPVPVVTIEAAGPFCQDALPVNLIGTPTGGVFSGEGVQDGQFIPEIAGYGTWPVIYFYTDENGCSVSNGTDITVYSLPEVFMYPVDPVCVTGNPVLLSGWPEGGVFSGSGIEGNMFNPALTGEGTFSIVYTYTDEQGCSNTSVQNITVNSGPQADFTLPSVICVNAPAFELLPTPEGGWFEGAGTYGYSFYPESAGVGTHQITYHYSDINACAVDVTHEITVLSLPELFIDPVNPICNDATPVTLIATPSGGYFTGLGVVEGIFYPAEVGPGIWTITYTYTDPVGCTNTASTEIMVNDLPQPYFYPVDPLCVSASPVLLTAWPEGGTFSGPGVEGNYFNPALSGEGTFQITYSFTNEYGCTGSVVQGIIVNTSTTAEFSIPSTICINADPVELTGTPEGGWFEGNGTYGNWFYPATAGAGTWTITYNYQENNCSSIVSHDITVLNTPQIVFDEIGPFCADNDPVTLHAIPTGGIFSGYGVSGDIFDPALSGPGYWELTYTITDENACTSAASIWVSVNDIPQTALYGPENICINADPVELIGYPEGGDYSGDGLEGNIFNPSLAGPGSHTLSYTFISEDGCGNTAHLTIVVDDITPVSIEPVAALCVNSEPVELFGYPVGGSFSGMEVWNNYFYPAWAGVGVYPIQYTFTNEFGCTSTSESTVTVNPVTDLIFNPLPDVCVNASPVDLNAYPEGGTFSGNGVNNNIFYPSEAGLGITEITYTYTNEFNCTSSVIQYVTVNNSTEVIFNLLTDVCINGEPVQLVAYPEGGTFSGTGVVDNLFYPSVSGTGTFTISYDYTSEVGCQGSASQTISVLPVTAVSMELPSAICHNAGPVLLTADPQGGVFSGEGVFENYFYPDNTGIGTWTITYTYTNEGGCISAISQEITVNPLTPVVIDPLSPLCEYSAAVELHATPEGGVFNGDGVSGASFDPALVGAGSWTISYTFTNEYGCESTANLIIEVVAAPFVTILSVDPVCNNTEPFTLAGYPEGGIFSGTGVESNMFNPALAGPGEWTVNYTYTDQYGCFGEASTIITVNPNVTVTIESFPTLCPDGEPVTLNGSPAGGAFSGTGVTGNIFSPAEAGPGTFTITYSWNDNGCGGTASTEITVNPYLSANAGQDITILEGASTTLTAMAEGGSEPYSYTWYPGTSLDDQFSATPVATPTITTVYTLMVMDGVGCMAVDEVTVNVITIQDDIHGRLTYMNSPMTPLNNCVVVLYQNGSEIETAITDIDGNYSFDNLPFGNYTLGAETSKPWGGGNAIDGLLMLKHFTGTIPLSGLKLQAGDVTGESVINAHDALNTMRRFVDLLDNFSPVGDWIFESPVLTIDGYTPQNIDFQGLCMGDVNGDNLPSVIIKPEPSVFTLNKGVIMPVNGNVSVPVISEQNLTVAAISFIVELPSGAKVEAVQLDKSSDNLIYNQIGNIVKIAWCSLEPLELGTGDRLLTLSLSNIRTDQVSKIQINGSSTLADDNAVIIRNSVFSIPEISGENTEITLRNYPNPFSESTQISYSLPADGKVKLNVYNLLGEKVAELLNEEQKSGNYQIDFSSGSLSQGTYIYKLEFSDSGHVYQRNGMMNISK